MGVATSNPPLADSPPDAQFFKDMQSEMDDKGFLVTSTEDLFNWGAHRLALVDDLWSRLLCGRDDPCEYAAL